MKKDLRTAFSTRQYMLSKDFEIYYYSDRNMKSIRSHSHNYYEFYFFLGGSLELEINGHCFYPQYGDMALIPPGTSHYGKILDSSLPYQRFIFWISQDYCSRLMELSPDYGYLCQRVAVSGKYLYHFDVFTFNSIQSKLFSLIEELHSRRFGKAAKIALCVSDLMFYLNRHVYELEHPDIPREERSLYQKLQTYIQEHLEEELTLERLAGEFFVSKYHISHVFKDNLGISLHQYILKKRLAAARDAILAGTDMSEASYSYGFRDYSSFYKAFRKEYGLSPSEYRRRHTL